ncbi:MAG: radical SAM protein, partial [Nanoarchaeota archaeon]|nr:radical SAM protein [Nanoarchaeota archaeon]
INELKDIKKCYHPTCFFFHDDTFVFKKDYLHEFLTAYKKEVNIPFACLIRADLATDETIKLLKNAGCYLISFGIESGNENIRNIVLKKNLSNEKILKCAKVLRKYKIPFATFNMVGLPDENLSETWDTADINIKTKPNWAWFSVYQTLPSTELARYALEKKYLGEVDVAEKDSSFHENSLILKNHPDGKKMLRLKNMTNLIIKMPFLKPVVKIALLLPLDPIYSLIDKFLYFIFYYSKLTYKSGLFDRIHSAIFIARHMKEFK